MKGASLVVYVNENGEVIGAKNINKKEGNVLETPIVYGEEEMKIGKKIVGVNKPTRLYIHNGCCWKSIGGKWICSPAYCQQIK
jgi:hypothetical protein